MILHCSLLAVLKPHCHSEAASLFCLSSPLPWSTVCRYSMNCCMSFPICGFIFSYFFVLLLLLLLFFRLLLLPLQSFQNCYSLLAFLGKRGEPTKHEAFAGDYLEAICTPDEQALPARISSIRTVVILYCWFLAVPKPQRNRKAASLLSVTTFVLAVSV